MAFSDLWLLAARRGGGLRGALRLGIALGRRDQIVSQNELGPRDVLQGQLRFAGLGRKADKPSGQAQQPAAEALTPFEWAGSLDTRLRAAEPIVILGPNQRAIDPRRADLEH